MVRHSKFYSFEEAKRKMEHYCSYQDRCHKEVETKLAGMGLISEARDQIIMHLIEQDFLNEERFALLYSRSKFNQKNWGRIRLKRELALRGISVYLIKKALSGISEEEYLLKFNELASHKWNRIDAPDLQRKKKKLLDYLIYRGWEHHLIYDKIRALSTGK